MRIKPALISCVLLAVMVNLPIGQAASAQSATAETTSIASVGTPTGPAYGWTVISVDVLPFTGASAYLSPNGKYVFTVQAGQLCLITVSDKSHKCIRQSDYPYLSVADYSVAWSPDSQNIAFSDDFFRQFHKSYIWVLNVDTMQPKNITDDGKVERFNFTDPTKVANNPKVDIAPHWSVDGRTLYFLRCEAPCSQKQPAVLYSIKTGGLSSGTAQKLFTLDQPLFFVYNFAVLPDESDLIYMISDGTTSNLLDGVYSLDLTDGTSKHLALVHQLLNVQLSADAQYALAYTPVAENNYPSGNRPAEHRIVNLTSNAITRVDPVRNGYFPGWSATGHSYAYLDQNVKLGEAGLYIVDQPGDPGQLVYNEAFLSVQTTWQGLQWAQDNTILVVEVQQKQMLLLHLTHS